ncbi:MAG: efflux RND transporter periplasmic adaptor subunit [Alphaproteobacteria bacterium]
MNRVLHVMGRLGAGIVIFGIGTLMAIALIAIRTAQGDTEPAPRIVSTVQVEELDTFVAERKFAGRIVPQQISDLSFELGGRIIALGADDGDTVSRGQRLAALDSDQLENRKAELEGQKREVEADLRRAEATLARTRELAPKGFSTQQDLDNIQAERDGAAARLRQIEAALRGVETDLEDTVLLAPFAGQIVRRYVDEGTVVQPGTAVYRLNETGVLEARIGIPPTFRRKVRVGEAYKISVGPLSADGIVTAIVSDVNTRTRTLTVILEIRNDPGFVARDLVRLSLKEEIRETGIWVPATSLNESVRGLWAVYVVDIEADAAADRGVVRRKDVEIVHIEEDRVFVRGTLAQGDHVVASSAFRLVPGQVVRVASLAGEDAQ